MTIRVQHFRPPQGDKGATNSRYPVHTARAAQPNYMLPLHATGLTRWPWRLVHPNVRPDGLLQDRRALNVKYKRLMLLAVPRGLEPPTFGLGNSSSRLNFERRCARHSTVFVAHVDVSLTGFDIVEPLCVNASRRSIKVQDKFRSSKSDRIRGGTTSERFLVTKMVANGGLPDGIEWHASTSAAIITKTNQYLDGCIGADRNDRQQIFRRRVY